MTDAAEDGALFGVTDARPTRPGEVAATFRRLVDQALQDGKLVDEDAALVAGVAVLAEALDTAHRVGGMKGGYLAAQAFPPYQRGLHALRLPVELTAATPPAPAASAGNGQDELTAFLRDLGTPEP
jgi:hypothetical protein